MHRTIADPARRYMVAVFPDPVRRQRFLERVSVSRRADEVLDVEPLGDGLRVRFRGGFESDAGILSLIDALGGRTVGCRERLRSSPHKKPPFSG
jgi:hypothetical protein